MKGELELKLPRRIHETIKNEELSRNKYKNLQDYQRYNISSSRSPESRNSLQTSLISMKKQIPSLFPEHKQRISKYFRFHTPKNMRDKSEKNLGPGSYSIHFSESSPGFEFSISPRFSYQKKNFTIKDVNSSRIKKETERSFIEKNMKVEYLDKSKELEEKAKYKKFKISTCLNTKLLLEKQKQLDTLISLDEKFKKVHFRLNKRKFDIVESSWVSILTLFSLCNYCKSVVSLRKQQIRHTQKVHRTIALIVLAIGKFKVKLILIRKRASYLLFKCTMIPLIHIHVLKLQDSYFYTVNHTVDTVLSTKSFANFFGKLKNVFKQTEKNIYDYLCVCRARRHALRLLWEKVYRKYFKKNVYHTFPPEVINYYLSIFLRQKLKEHSERIQFFMNSESDTLSFPVLRLYHRKHMYTLIKQALKEKSQWATLAGLPDSIAKIYLKKRKHLKKGKTTRTK